MPGIKISAGLYGGSHIQRNLQTSEAYISKTFGVNDNLVQ